VLTSSRALSDFFEEVVSRHSDARVAATWVMGEVLAWVKEQRADIAAFPMQPTTLAELLDAVRAGALSRTAAKRVFDVLLREGGTVAAIAEREGLAQVDDVDAVGAWVDDVWQAHPAEAARLVAGEKKLLGVLVGLVMKASGGRADPRRVNELLQARAARA
jgi:aspartyl-tRNA(Asn)/glutamyl-tRNA(Gln) amidotransferase subunit B